MRLLTHPQARFQGFFMPRTLVSGPFSRKSAMHLTSAMHSPGLGGHLHLILQPVYSMWLVYLIRWQSDP